MLTTLDLDHLRITFDPDQLHVQLGQNCNSLFWSSLISITFLILIISIAVSGSKLHTAYNTVYTDGRLFCQRLLMIKALTQSYFVRPTTMYTGEQRHAQQSTLLKVRSVDFFRVSGEVKNDVQSNKTKSFLFHNNPLKMCYINSAKTSI